MTDNQDDVNISVAAQENAEMVGRLITILELKGILSEEEAEFIINSDDESAEVLAESLSDEEKERYNEMVEDRL